MKRLLVLALFGLVACGGGDAKTEQGLPVNEAPSATAAEVRAIDDEARQGCSSFTQAVADEENNEVYDPQTRVLRVYVGQQRYVLSSTVQECRDNPVAMKRLRLAEEVEESNQPG